jgi:glycosyltransferase involved in cell wall biosynthesis
VVTAYYAPHIGGVETYTEQIVRAARASADLDVMVITAATGFRTQIETLDGTTVVRLGTWWRLSNTPLSPLWPLTVARVLRTYRIDVVNAHAPVPFLPDIAVAMAGRRRTILTYHSGTMIKGSHWSDRLLSWYERHVLPRLLRRADEVVAVSKTSLASQYPTARLINPGVDLARFRPAELEQAELEQAEPQRGEPSVPTIMYVGRIERTSAWKGVDVLIQAFSLVHEKLPEARLVLVGGGDAIDDHRELAGRLGVAPAVTFLGPLTGDELVSAYQNASVVVLPSRTEAESFGLALIEAMACGRPVIGSRIGGIPEVIADEETGLLVSPGNPLALAEACLRVLTDADLARRLAGAGRRTVLTRWSWQQTGNALLALVRNGPA